MECERLNLLDSLLANPNLSNNSDKVKVVIDTSFNIANRKAHDMILAVMEDKFSFRQLVELNRQVHEKLGKDYLFSLF